MRRKQMMQRWAGLLVMVPLGSALVAPPAAVADEVRAPADFVSLSDVDPSILMDVRYATPHNFTADLVDGYREPMCILTRPTAQALRSAQQDFLAEGYTLKVYDCYRPQRAVNDFVSWASNPFDQRMKAEFYPQVDKSQLFSDGYIAEKSGHSRGSTVDLTLVPSPTSRAPASISGQPLEVCTGPQPQRFPDNSIDMGTGFDCFDTLAHTFDPRIQGQQRANRLRLKDGLGRHGLQNYANEWWHYTFSPEPYPDMYFDFVVEPASLSD